MKSGEEEVYFYENRIDFGNPFHQVRQAHFPLFPRSARWGRVELVWLSQPLNAIQYIKVIGKLIEMADFTVNILPKIEVADRARNISLRRSFYTCALIHFAQGGSVSEARKDP